MLDANITMRSIVRRNTENGSIESEHEMAQALVTEMPARDDFAILDQKRSKTGPNTHRIYPNDPDTEVTRMNNSRMHFANMPLASQMPQRQRERETVSTRLPPCLDLGANLRSALAVVLWIENRLCPNAGFVLTTFPFSLER